MADTNRQGSDFLCRLNREFEQLHTTKEDAFWAVQMGNAEDAGHAQDELNDHERQMKAFITDPSRLRQVKAEVERAKRGEGGDLSEEEALALKGWLNTFEANVVDDAEARQLASELVDDEGRLNQARMQMSLGYEHPTDGFVNASSVRLSVLMSTDPDTNIRKAAFEGLRSIEQFVLENGFLDIVRKRNQYGRLLGGEDFYDATVRRVEGMSKVEVFELLGELEEKTRDRAREALKGLEEVHGSVAPWNLRYLVSGDITKEQDPHFPFSRALERWGRSFAALGINYRDATLVLDLLDRKGKYENGFMHGPVLAWRENGDFHPARIQFTANAIPGMVGSGRSATETLFHEGGHAAHFANIDMPSPCFSQEFAPSSVAFAETQSMFLDSLLSDADWQSRYAFTSGGDAMPFALVEKAIGQQQPFAALGLRSMLSVCYAEKALYEIPDDELTPERVLREIRDVERRLLFLEEGSPRPVLSVPHLLTIDSSAYYHGYVLAEMAVEQTRSFFKERDGHIVDNQRVGPDLRSEYWCEGNLRRFGEFVERLTKKPLSASDLANKAIRDADLAISEARESVGRLSDVASFEGEVNLGAQLRVAHGRETIAEGAASDFDRTAKTFQHWIEEHEKNSPTTD